MSPPRRGLLLAAGVVMVVSLGLPWSATGDISEVGFQSIARVTAVAGALVLAAAVRRRQRSLVLWAAGIAVIGALVDIAGPVSSGRIAYLLAVALAVIGSGLAGREA